MILIIFSQQFYYVQVNSHLHGYAGIKPLLLSLLLLLSYTMWVQCFNSFVADGRFKNFNLN